MANADGLIRFGYIMDPFGNHTAAWVAPELDVGQATSFAHYKSMATQLERAKFDLLFIADFPSLPDGTYDQISRSQFGANVFEPLTILAALAAVTDRIGLVATASTSYNEPYNVARAFASLDHISAGRAGWNAVTTRWRAAAANFGRKDLDDHGVRYRRAKEFVSVVRGLWNSWEADAFSGGRATGRYFDPEKMHLLDHVGEFYSVKGPLNIARPPQHEPVITQAGGSDDGRDLAAESAEAVFSLIPSIEAAKTYYADLKGRMAAYGRDPDQLKVLTGVTVVVGESRDEAEEKSAAVSRRIHEDVGRSFIQGVLDAPLDDLPYDAPIPPERIPANSNKGQTYFAEISRLARDEKLTIRQLGARFAESRIGGIVKGTPSDVADYLEHWYREGATDGFMLKSNLNPTGLEDICNLVMPEMRRRGLARQDYAGPMLRDNLGLARPVWRGVPASRAAAAE